MRNTFLAVVVLLASVANASAYSHSFLNKSKYTVYFWMNYASCSNDSWTVKPGETITWRSGLCCGYTPSMKLGDKTIGGPEVKPHSPVVVTPGGPIISGSVEMFCKNTNWRFETDDWTMKPHTLERL